MESFQSQSQSQHPEKKEDIKEILTFINLKRTHKLSVILFLSNIIFLFLDFFNKVKGHWMTTDGYRYLFYSHIFLGIFSLLYFLVFYRITASSAKDITSLHKFYVSFFAFVILILTAVISGSVDQQIHGQITVYIMGCFVIAILYYYTPKFTAFLYGLSWIVFTVLLTLTQNDPNIRQGHYGNASLSVIIAYFLSGVLYKLKQQDLIHKFHLEDLVAERTMELQIANDLLKEEILERSRAEKEMLRLDRLNIIGEMAASISHEVRNPMTTVKGFLQLLKDKQVSRDKEYFDLMIEEIDRANSILTEFLSISRTKPTFLIWYNLNDIVTSTLPLIKADAINSDKLLKVELNNVPNLQLDIHEIRQLLLNLTRNGFEAMSNGRQLTIMTYSTNGEVILAVSDEGNGMEQYILEKLGQPFFTTKEQGTGLGLAVCYGIVSRHNASISVETSPKGSTFSVYFKIEE